MEQCKHRKHVDTFFGLPARTHENDKAEVAYGDLVNLLATYDQKTLEKPVELPKDDQYTDNNFLTRRIAALTAERAELVSEKSGTFEPAERGRISEAMARLEIHIGDLKKIQKAFRAAPSQTIEGDNYGQWLPEDEFQATVLVLQEVIQERKRQHARFGQRNDSPVLYGTILNEEVGEVNKEICEWAFGDDQHQKEAHVKLRKELIQVLAVGVAMVTCMDRNQR